MRTQPSREETTLRIGASLFAFATIVLIGGALLVMLNLAGSVPGRRIDRSVSALPWVALAGAVVHFALGHRRRHPGR